MIDDRLSLYIGLEEGRSADLGVVASAALAWEGLVKEVFALIGPGSAVRIELVNSTEGSLKLNTLIQAISRVKGQNPKTIAAIYAILAFFALAPFIHAQTDLGDWLAKQVGHEDGFNDTQKQEMRDTIDRALRDNAAREQKRAVFAELSRDPAIISVGVMTDPTPNVRPDVTIPRADFSRLRGLVVDEPPMERRTVKKTITATLVSPVLKGQERAWRFQEDDGSDEFSATMRDPKMLAALDEPHGVTVTVGTEMTLDVSDREEKEDGVWQVLRREIKRVHNPELLNDSLQLPLDQHDEP